MNRHDLNATYSAAARYGNDELLRLAIRNNREYARSRELRTYLSSLSDTVDLAALFARIDAILAERAGVSLRSSSATVAPAPPYVFNVDPASTLAEPVHWCWVSSCRVRFFGSEQAIGLIRQEVDPLALELPTPGLLRDQFGYWFHASTTPRLWLLLTGVNRRASPDLLRYDTAVCAGQFMVGSNSAADMFHASSNTGEPFPAAAPASSSMVLDESDRYEPVAKRHVRDRVRVIRARLIRVRPAWPGELKTAADEYMASGRSVVRETANPATLLGADRPPAPPAGAARLWEAEPFSLALHQQGQCTLYKLQFQSDDATETVSWLVAYKARPQEVPSHIEHKASEYTLVLMAHNTRVQAAFPMSEQLDIAQIVLNLVGADVAWRFIQPDTLSLTNHWVALPASAATPNLEHWDLSTMND
jgi:hypothetical protein